MIASTIALKTRRYFLNPLTYTGGFYVVQITLLPLAYMQFAPQLVDEEYYLLTFLISVLYFVGVAMGYALAPRLGGQTMRRVFSIVQLRYSGRSLTLQQRKILSIGMFALFLAAFAVHMVVSGGGLLWITNSRQAYAAYRIGVGPTYALSLMFLYLALIFSLFAIRLDLPLKRIIINIVLRVLFFSFFSYFLGSKGYIISVATVGLLFYNYNVQPVRPKFVILFAFMILATLVALLLVQGSASGSEDVVSYADYYQNTSEFLRRFPEFGGHRWGEVMITDLWGYAPRALFPNKPYEYGQLLLNKVLFPGATELGYTPAFMVWTPAYLDFGLPGVIITGLYSGILLGWVNRYYISQPPSVTRFILLMQMCFTSVFPWIPFWGLLLVVMPLFSAAVMGCGGVFSWLRPVKP